MAFVPREGLAVAVQYSYTPCKLLTEKSAVEVVYHPSSLEQRTFNVVTTQLHNWRSTVDVMLEY